MKVLVEVLCVGCIDSDFGIDKEGLWVNLVMRKGGKVSVE